MIPIHKNLTGRVAVVTGGSGVLCSEMARELSRQGMKIAILNRIASKGESVANSIIEAGGQALALPVDVLDRDSLEEAKQQILEKFGRIDLLVNGAGGNHPDAITAPETYDEKAVGQSFFDLDERGFSSVFSLNFTGTFLACQVFGQELLKSESPAIINLSSMSAYAPLTKIPAYSAAKASINSFTQWLAVHFAETGLRVNAIAPGFFLTDQNRDLLMDKDGNPTARTKKILEATPMNKFGEPENLLGALLFLADESYSSFVTGTTMAVDGGFMAYSGV
ncbi:MULTISPECIES: SDR family oxidoreductase [unclassified Planococcus (in: firmicutes)]|uniref:SDR family oxidoreductase n=1 Tax=unclassified Planococcus (in: firmicutes) TaxID=2662419 RepID=UPI000C32A080|nr:MULTISPECIES: SDR family oxidoreductase [unclassified Planococcus (in: firmicutes)]AUD13116.1 D-mannonate oxidoreductase [Planococcus sp. MB-3u-03]PKG45401.1 D-mannonate oxidoreductase [Planococcus sp. Urea-trap-24]PKG89003.1 D-mannonate oxidoreductase [Planococcus sp. Urea-3u-39]PKH36371.1 D-mannonate oxidoreductase [Planococcus sp. MB-3u-09]